MNKAINYAHLAKKYLNADIVVHDRTFDGLEWKGPGEKPSISLFVQLQAEEDRHDRRAASEKEMRIGIMEERQAQARALAAEEAIPFEEKMRKIEADIKAESLELMRSAIESQAMLRSRNSVIDCWKEISAASEILVDEARQFLIDTQHLIAPDAPAIDPVIAEKRKRAFEVINEGETVFAEWQKLRADEMPTRKEIQNALKVGGAALDKIRERCKDAALKYPKPKKRNF